MAVALATAAAAEAAVAAAHAAAHVVRLTGQAPVVPPLPRQVRGQGKGQEHEREQAAVAIQSAYRGYLVRTSSVVLQWRLFFFCSRNMINK